VCLSQQSTAAVACGGFAAGQIDSGGRQAATAPQHGVAAANAGSVTFTAAVVG